MIRLQGYIQDYDGEALTLVAPFSCEGFLLEKQGITEAEIILRDGRQISPSQRNKILMLCADITDYITGYYIQLHSERNEKKRRIFEECLRELQLAYVMDITDREEVRRQLTYNYCQIRDIDLFSIASKRETTLDMSTARDFIDWLVELCLRLDIPCRDSLLNRCEDVQRYMYACVVNVKCCICGKRADIHEVDTVGMGRNRLKIHHLGQRVQPLCREHHGELDNMGQQSFDAKYHLQSIVLDELLLKILHDRLGWKG